MELTPLLILFVVLAGVVKGFSGFGLSIILIAVLLQSGIEPSLFMPILVPIFVLLDLFLLFEYRNEMKINFRKNFALQSSTILSLFIGCILGTYFLIRTNPMFLKPLFAILVLFFIFLIIKKYSIAKMTRPSEGKNALFAFGSGILTGLFTMNAVTATLYLTYHHYTKKAYMRELITYLTISNIMLVGIYLVFDLFSYEGFILSMKLFFIVLLGFFIGVFIRRVTSSSYFRIFVIFILAINALKMLFDYFYF